MALLNNFKDFDKINDGVKKLASNFGASVDDNNNVVFRPFSLNRGYLAFTDKGQPESGEYSGLSFVIFPIAVKGGKSSEDKDGEQTDKEGEKEENSPEGNAEETLSSEGVDTIKGKYICVVSIGIGTGNLGDDEEMANLPYLRRVFSKLRNCNYADDTKIYLKNSFADVVNESSALFQKLDDLKSQYGTTYTFDLSVINKYKKLLPAAGIIELDDSDFTIMGTLKSSEDLQVKSKKNSYVSAGLSILAGWLAQYAEIRDWDHGFGPQKLEKKIINRSSFITSITKVETLDDNKNIKNLLKSERFIVLEGAPGTGKTREANLIANKYFNKNNIFFIQFHAETTYADFIGGIKPVLPTSDSSSEVNNIVSFIYEEGPLTKAILRARELEKDFKGSNFLGENDEYADDKAVLLVIDEINRANLANVLGPVFYLFEKDSDYKDKIELTIKTKDGNIQIKELPKNLYVVATMNTADRSLAVVDFALRRRFTWYTLLPKKLDTGTLNSKLYFKENVYERISKMFEKYASDEELNLQPGQSYFILHNTSNNSDIEEQMIKRMKYEIMPLMKEYFNEGFLSKMIDEFSNYYTELTDEFMYK